ncbi:MAG: dihydropteroate synthase [Candidatus Entotheonellia bacterium]
MHAKKPKLIGVVNITEDSFSDGGLFLEASKAIEQSWKLIHAGADIIELGPASSHPDAKEVSAQEEIQRLKPVLDQLLTSGTAISVDSSVPETQIYCAQRGVAFLNDIQGFPHNEILHVLANATCKLVVMHSVQRRGKATRIPVEPQAVVEGIYQFFQERLQALRAVGITQDRVILDPGMGYFLGSNAEPSLLVLREIPRLNEMFHLPLLISVSRKSFLGTLTGRGIHERGAASLAAEIFAASQGVDYIRTHDVAALNDALTVLAALTG